MLCGWGGNCRPGGKSNGSLPPGMVTCGLTACTPGSVLGPTLNIEYGKPLPLPFLLVVCSNCVSTLHRFRGTAIFTAYLTACDIEKTLNFAMTDEVAGYVRFPIHL